MAILSDSYKPGRHQHPMVEVGWEVCNKIGGIYTVLRSKASTMVRRLEDRYCLLGPYSDKVSPLEFEELPRTGPFGKACELLERRGIKAHYGRWLVDGRPQVVLIDYLVPAEQLQEYKYYFWKDQGIETGDEKQVNDAVAFGYLAAEFFVALIDGMKELSVESPGNGSRQRMLLPVIAHFHEWMASVGIPLLESRRLPVTTVFTTHATVLGRYLANDNSNFYFMLPRIDPEVQATKYGIAQRYAIEKTAAHKAVVFSTISDITAWEAEHLLGRRPDVLTPNGISIPRFASSHELQNLHTQFKRKIDEFVIGHFFPNYSFDLDKTLYVFTSGRYEYFNKGLDLFIESLSRLNFHLKKEDTDLTVVAFIISPAPHHGLNVDLLESRALLSDFRRTCMDLSERMVDQLMLCAAQGKMPTIDNFMDDNSQLQLRRVILALKKRPLPSIVTHNMVNDADDPILNKLREFGLLNRAEDSVKVVFHPEFLTSMNPLIGLDYDQFVRGAHLGVFPSYYEPWGYTPLECVALGVPTITSDLSGFGIYTRNRILDHERRGIYIVDRRYKSFNDSVEQLTDYMLQLLELDERERAVLRNRVEATSVKFDWQEMAKEYWISQRLSITRRRELVRNAYQ